MDRLYEWQGAQTRISASYCAKGRGIFFVPLLHYNIYNSFLGGCFTGNNSVFVKMFHVEHQIFASFYFVKAVEVLGEM